MPESVDRLIVADLGGTNGRFALAQRDGPGAPFGIEQIKVYPSRNYAGLTPLLQHYLDELGPAAPQHACIAVAGPVDGERARVTNLDWTVQAQELASSCGLERVRLANDFAALAAITPSLAAGELHRIAAGSAQADAPISVVGPGTGLGVAILVPIASGWRVVPTEGGHMAFAAVSEIEQELLRHLQRECGHVSAEVLLCGEGLARIHSFLCQRAGAVSPGMTPAEVSSAALAASDELCLQAVQLYLGILGSVAGDLALAHGARGGVYFGGGVLPRLIPLIADSTLHARFVDKGKMRAYVQDLPIQLVTAQDAALRGAANLFDAA